MICRKGKLKKPSSLLVEDDRREALLLGHSIMCASVVHERLDVVLDHLAAAVRALFSNVSPFSVHTVVETGRLSQTHNDRLLFRLDGETVGLDRGTGAGGFGLLVLALDLEGSA